MSNEVTELIGALDEESVGHEETIDASLVPNKCITCHNNPICHGLTSILNLVKIGIKLQIDRCRYFRRTVDSSE